MREPPSGDLRAVDAVLVRMGPASDLRVTEPLFRVAADPLQFWDAVDGPDRQGEAIDLVVHRQLHRCVDIAFLLVTANMDVSVVAGIGKAVYQIRMFVV